MSLPCSNKNAQLPDMGLPHPHPGLCTWACMYSCRLLCIWFWEFFRDCLKLTLEGANILKITSKPRQHIHIKKIISAKKAQHAHEKKNTQYIWLTSVGCSRQQGNKLLVIVQSFHSINHIGFAFSCGSASAQSKRSSFLFCVENKMRTGLL